jgi:hypothetical protein
MEERLELLGRNRGFLQKHDGNVVPDGVNALAHVALQPGIVR